MARPRKPTNVLELKGAFAKNPQRRRTEEPEPEGEIGDPPEGLSEAERACWLEVVDLAHKGTLCRTDRMVVEHLARVLAELRASEEYVKTDLMIRFEMCLGRLGMTPADRSRVSVRKPKRDANPFEEFKRPAAGPR